MSRPTGAGRFRVWVPAMFWLDHSGRFPCDGGSDTTRAAEVRRAGRRVLIEGDCWQMMFVAADARYCTDPWWHGHPPALRRSAATTMRALQAALR